MKLDPKSTQEERVTNPDGDLGGIRPRYIKNMGIPVNVSTGSKHDIGSIGASGLTATPMPDPSPPHVKQPANGSSVDS